MSAVDLSFAESVVEGRMGDTGSIYSPGGLTDDGFDRTTGTWASSTPTAVYADRCMVRDESSTTNESAEQGEAEASRDRWVVKIPLDAPTISRGMLVIITASRDARMVGKRLMVTSTGGGTFKVSRRLNCVSWELGQTQDPAS